MLPYPYFAAESSGTQHPFSPRWPSLENISLELKTVLPHADFVIEGCVDPTEPLRDEGPFGDHTGYYTLPEPYPVFHVTAITHRKDAVYPATIVGMPPMEDFYIKGSSLSTLSLSNVLSEPKTAHLPPICFSDNSAAIRDVNVFHARSFATN